VNSNPRPIGWLVLLCRFAIAALFLLAAFMKLRDIPSFALAIQAFRIIPDHAGHVTRFAAYFIPWFEVVAGLALLFGVWTRAAALALSLLLGAFMVMIVTVVLRGIDTTCSCFGKLDLVCKGGVGWCHVGRNAVLMAMGLLVAIAGPGPLTIDRREVK